MYNQSLNTVAIFESFILQYSPMNPFTKNMGTEYNNLALVDNT